MHLHVITDRSARIEDSVKERCNCTYLWNYDVDCIRIYGYTQTNSVANVLNPFICIIVIKNYV